jgi:hypothetical protein
MTIEGAGTLRRVLGTIVALMLIGSALGMLGALIYPDRKANLLSWKDADRQTGQSGLRHVRLNLARPPIGHDQRKTGNGASAPSAHAHPVRPTHL